MAGLHRCCVQPLADAPRIAPPIRLADLAIDYRAHWQDAPVAGPYRNPYRIGWKDFLRHLVTNLPLSGDFAAGLRDVKFAEACGRSVREKEWVDL